MRAPPSDNEFEQYLWRQVKGIHGSGVTSDRPVDGIEVGDEYFDTTLGYKIWWNGTNWVDATGSTV